MCTLVCKGLGVFIVAWGWHSFLWQRRSFLVGEIFFNSHILRDPFLIGLSLIRVKRGAQDISLYAYTWRPREAMSASSKVRLSSLASFVNFISRPYILVDMFRCLLSSRCNHQLWSGTIYFILLLSGHERASEIDEFIRTVTFA